MASGWRLAPQLLSGRPAARRSVRDEPKLSHLLGPNAMLLPIQNGGVPQMLAERLGNCVLGGLSNLGATMEAPGIYQQRNAGHLLIGELAGGESERTERVHRWLERGRGPRDMKPPGRGMVEAGRQLFGNHDRRYRWRHHAWIHGLAGRQRTLQPNL